MFLDSELRDVLEAKARLGAQADLRRQVIRLELVALRARARQKISGLTLGLGVAGKALDYLRARRCR